MLGKACYVDIPTIYKTQDAETEKEIWPNSMWKQRFVNMLDLSKIDLLLFSGADYQGWGDHKHQNDPTESSCDTQQFRQLILGHNGNDEDWGQSNECEK